MSRAASISLMCAQSFEELKTDKVDLCVIDAFPGMDIEDITQKAEKIADNVVII